MLYICVNITDMDILPLRRKIQKKKKIRPVKIYNQSYGRHQRLPPYLIKGFFSFQFLSYPKFQAISFLFRPVSFRCILFQYNSFLPPDLQVLLLSTLPPRTSSTIDHLRVPPRALHPPITDNPPPHPDHAPRHRKDDRQGGQHREADPRHAAAVLATLARVEEPVDVEALGGAGDVGDAEVEEEDEDEEREVEEGVGRGGGEEDLEEGEDAGEGVLRDLWV